MDSLAIGLDLDSALEHDLFDASLRRRLGTLGPVTTVRGTDQRTRLACDVLVTGWHASRLPDVLPEGSAVRLVAHSAGTVRPFVPCTLLQHGLRVTQSTAGMARSVAELAVWCTISLQRSLHRVDRTMQGLRDWQAASSFGFGSTLHGTTVGVVGASRVGKIYIELLRAFGASVQVYDPYLSEDEAARLGAERVGLDELFASAGVVALHAPVTDETRNMVSAARLASLPDGALLINTARSGIVDSLALERELLSGRISAALDVFDREPLPASSPLFGLPNVVAMPHLGAVTTQSRHDQGVIVVEEIERFARGDRLQHEVTAESYERLA